MVQIHTRAIHRRPPPPPTPHIFISIIMAKLILENLRNGALPVTQKDLAMEFPIPQQIEIVYFTRFSLLVSISKLQSGLSKLIKLYR